MTLQFRCDSRAVRFSGRGRLRDRNGAWLCSALLVVVPLQADDNAARLNQGLTTIQSKDVDAHIEFFTSDECAGRDTPQPGLTRACEYVAERFKEFGLEPLGEQQDSYQRHYGLSATDATDQTTLLIVSHQKEDLEGRLREDFIPAKHSAQGVAEGEVVFAGYGIKDKQYRWDSFKKVDVRGKVVVVLVREPRADSNTKNFFDGLEATDPSALRVKAEAAAEKGAVGLLVCAPSRQESKLWLNSQHPLYSSGRGTPKPLAIPTAIIGFELAERILGTPPDRLRDAIDGKKRPGSFEVEGLRVRLEVELKEVNAPVANVVARYQGRDEKLFEEVVIVGAHLDHIGVDDRGRVYRGADDNAGGAAALLEVAEAFSKAQPVVRRSVIFIAFTGEEKGLLGANAYVKEPAVPMDMTYAMINMDIISRGRKTAIEATFPNEKGVLDKLIGQATKLSGCRLKVGRGGKEFFQRSDQYAFHQAGVPTVFFNEGATNEDYHRWSDTADKVIDDKVARVAKLGFTLAYLTANSDIKGGLK